MKKKLTGSILILSLLLNIGLIYKFFYQGEKVTVKEDGRSEIRMSGQNREYVMSEMRSFLESVQKINEGIAKNDPDLIASVGQQSGTCKVNAVPQGLVKSLPFEFKQMGFGTHELFDEMAKMTKEKYNRQQIQLKMNELLNNCVVCHKTYKITAEIQ
ncbi:hypothetical protein MKJ01_12265 [Chryseobacterium sp. SSA4.19]|uniref:hypothetical protein n=1 Tax=Chryseobacterium sp. SSA4.19 TaxID=2919915 RepID=UPI001F4D77BD|nr:hypothetical protein [Chryseobacterium sp. SSA4.19]MCJ8154539.1 hypothetical protein [Chryseobacterium sp. SSA4.19]